MTAERIKITYATLRADNEELQQQYEAGLERAKGRLGQVHRNLVDGAERDGDGTFEVRSPIDTDILVGTFARGTRADVQDAIAAAAGRGSARPEALSTRARAAARRGMAGVCGI